MDMEGWMNQQLLTFDRFPEGGNVNIGNISIEAPVSGDLVQIGHGNMAVFQLKVAGAKDATIRLNPQDSLWQLLTRILAEGRAQSEALTSGGFSPTIVAPCLHTEDFQLDAPFSSPFGIPSLLSGNADQLAENFASLYGFLGQLDQQFGGTLVGMNDGQQDLNVSALLLQKGNQTLWRFRQGALRLFAEQTSLYMLTELQDPAQPMLGAFQTAAKTNLEVLRGWVLFQKYRTKTPALIDLQAFNELSQGHWQVVLDLWSTGQCLSPEQAQAERSYLNALGDHYDTQMVQIAVREAEWYFREALRRQPNQSAALVNLAALLSESALLAYIEMGRADRTRLEEARKLFQQAHAILNQRQDRDGQIALAQCLLYEATSLPPDARLEIIGWASSQMQQLRNALEAHAPELIPWGIAQRNLARRDPSFVDRKKIEQARDILMGAGAMAILTTLAEQWLSTHSQIIEKIKAVPGYHLPPSHPEYSSNSTSAHASPPHSIHKDIESHAAEAPSKIEIAKQGIHISRRALLATGLTAAGLVTTGGLVISRVFMQNAKSSPPSTPVPTTSTQTVETDTPLYTYYGHSGGINGVHSVAWFPNNSQRIASAGDDGTVQVWDATTGDHVFTYHGGGGELAWSPNGQFIASSTYDSVQIWDVSNGNSVYTSTSNGSALAWSPDGKYIASGGTDNMIHVWDATTGSNVYIYTGHSDVVRSLAWSPDSQRIASGSDDKTVQVWDATTGNNVYIYPGYTGLSGSFGAFAVAWSPNGQHIASGGNDDTVQVWDATTGQRVYTYLGHSDRVYAVAWSPDSQRIASGSSDGTAQAWDATTGNHSHIYRVQPHGTFTNVFVNAVAWSPNGKLIASGGSDGAVEVWSAGS